ncbi:TerC family protein [Candidatus Berkiella cookevillensis]|uniref:TerC family protein n=1 Tax=Candidatus Berkiella cookevillensis TaxID=437022 RepID=A0A0Q9YGW7_9GAMM|nr:TerC family protein [Candidatus Berkiella cookevillensis]MCS5708574.1 TerC family protein [Candidatus Berkiella cookevillensis]
MEWLTWINDPHAWVALATLTALEIVLGIDNIIFLTILVGRLPPAQRQSARLIGLGLAMGTRILLLFSIAWVMTLTNPLFSILEMSFSGRDLILIIGGLFLMAKSTHEIHNSLESDGEAHDETNTTTRKVSYLSILIQIALLDVVFSLDSVITAVGLAEHVEIMVIAIVTSVLVMMFSAKSIGEFVDEHPTLKMLALSFLILVGVALLGEGFELHIPKGYIYFAMAFSVMVEMLNIKMSKKRKLLKLNKNLP